MRVKGEAEEETQQDGEEEDIEGTAGSLREGTRCGT